MTAMGILSFFNKKKAPDVQPQGCYATLKVAKENARVGYMYREEPDPDSELPDSGWRFFAGDEQDEYLDDPENIVILSLSTVKALDPAVIPYLEAPYGSAFLRSGDAFVRDRIDER